MEEGMRMNKVEAMLRFMSFVAALLSLLLILLDKERKAIAISPVLIFHKEATFTNLQALVYGVIVSSIAGTYSLVHMLRCYFIRISSIRGVAAWAIFMMDQGTTYLVLSSASVIAESGYLSKEGSGEFGWMPVCRIFGRFCERAAFSLLFSFLTVLCMALTSLLSAYSLFSSSTPTKP